MEKLSTRFVKFLGRQGALPMRSLIVENLPSFQILTASHFATWACRMDDDSVENF